MVSLWLEAVLVGNVVEGDDLAIRCSPCDRSLDGDFFGIRSQVVDNGGFLAGDAVAGLVTTKKIFLLTNCFENSNIFANINASFIIISKFAIKLFFLVLN